MDNYKEKLKSIAFSQPIFAKIEDISKRHDLNIDQEGELAAAIQDVILEYRPASEFTRDIEKRLEIKSAPAMKLAEDVDKEIFKLIKSMVQQLLDVEQAIAPKPATPPPAPPPAPTPKPSITPIEKAGDFEVVKPQPSASPIYNDHTLTKEDVLADLENIQKLKPETAEMYVEHLIEAPVPPPTPPAPPAPQPVAKDPVVPPLIVEIKKPATPPPPPPPAPEQKKYSSPDPYREPI